MMNPEQKMQDESEFANAFSEDVSVPEKTEDEAFGMDMPGSDSEENTSGPALAVVIDAEPAEGEAADESVAEAVADEAPALDVAKETQRLKSWEGRLKALQRELDAKATTPAELADVAADVSDDMEDGELNDTPMDEDTEEKGADITLDAAMARLAEDFGDEFVAQIKAVAMASAKEAVSSIADGAVSGVTDQIANIVDDLTATKSRLHFREVRRAHPDFVVIADSPDFTAWLGSLSDGERERAEEVAERGEAEDVIELLDKFKQASQPAPAVADKAQMPVDEAQVDAAEGVSGGAMRLPAQPGASEDFKAAWDEFR